MKVTVTHRREPKLFQGSYQQVLKHLIIILKLSQQLQQIIRIIQTKVDIIAWWWQQVWEIR